MRMSIPILGTLVLIFAFVPAASAVGPTAWSDDSIDVTPVGSRVFLGQFGSETVSLSLAELPPHAELTLTFDLFVIQSWDGNFRKFGPDVFDLTVAEGSTLLHTTFANPDTDQIQAYPDAYPGGEHPAGTGAAEGNSLGYPFSGDSVYHLTFTFPHADATVGFDFSASLSEGITDESWGLDDVEVAADGEVVYSSNEPEAVLTGRAGESWAFANDEYLAFTRYPRTITALARPIAGGETTQLNAIGTSGITGGFDPGTNRVIYQQFTNRSSGVYFYDLDTGERSRVEGVNSRDWEWFPLISSSYIAFQRSYDADDGRYVDLLVLDRATGELRPIGTWKERPRLTLWLDDVGDRYLTYMLIDGEGQNVYLYDLQTDTEQQIPNPGDRLQVVAVVDEVHSMVYFGREIRQCGRNSGIWSLPIDLTGEPTKIVDLPDGISVGWTASLTASSTGHTDLYFEFYDCWRSDVFVAPAVDTALTA